MSKGKLDEKGFVFLDDDSRPYRCCMYCGTPWLFYWHPDKVWVTLKPVTQTDIWSMPHNLTQEQQDCYFSKEEAKR